MAGRHLLVAGASGVIGSEAVEHFTRSGWTVTALSRRRPIVAKDCRFDHVALDLSDSNACRAAVISLSPVTHLIYAAVSEAPGLITGWYDAGVIAANGAMFANLLDPLTASGALEHVALLQGTKAYGAHHHVVDVPCREGGARDPHPNFYWLQEDHVRVRAAEAGFRFTIFRPQVLLGAAPGAAMNFAAPIGAYAALCRELGRPFAYPGSPTAVLETVDTGLLAEAFDWAFASNAATDETFNITNGDVFVPAHDWSRLAEALDVDAGAPEPLSLAAFFATEEVEAAWARLVAKHDLRMETLPWLLGQSHHYVDLLIGARITEKAVPVLLSTVKVRQAGFAQCRDSLASLLHWIGRMADLKLLPPFAAHAIVSRSSHA